MSVTLKRGGKLRALARAGHSLSDAPGFMLPKVEAQHFATEDGFRSALKAQENATALIESDDILKAIDIDGRIAGTDYRLSPEAFGDLCHFGKMPVSFVKNLAKVNEQLALDVVESQLASHFQRGGAKMLIVDSRSNRIEGIVGSKTYSPLSNHRAYEYAMSATTDGTFSNGWMSGSSMRMTAIDRLNPVEPRQGDIVQLGTAVENSINGNRSFKVQAYGERLVCTNGMVVRESGSSERIPHQGDIEFKVQHAVVQCSDRACSMVPMMRAAAERLMLPEDIRKARALVRNPRRGGNDSLDAQVVRAAMRQSGIEGRQEDEVTLWNFVNGVTESAHSVKTVARRVAIESLGFDLLHSFYCEN